MSSKPSRAAFLRWITANGGTVLDPKNPYEFARFRGGDGLCIIYRDKAGTMTSFQGVLCREAWDAFRAKRKLDLAPTPIMNPKNVWSDRAKALTAIIDVRKGDLPLIKVRPFARQHRLTARFLVCFAIQHGLRWDRHQLVRAA